MTKSQGNLKLKEERNIFQSSSLEEIIDEYQTTIEDIVGMHFSFEVKGRW